jgi:hypothetical protein
MSVNYYSIWLQLIRILKLFMSHFVGNSRWPAIDLAYGFDRKVIHAISVEDGTITKIATGLENVQPYHVSWSPDGDRIAFGAFRRGKDAFLLMDNFHPGD